MRNIYTAPIREAQPERGSGIGGLAIAALLLDVPLLLWSAFILSSLWRWFLVPVGLPDLTYAEMVGVTFVLSFLRTRYRRDGPGDPLEALVIRVAFALAMGAWFLLVGWLLHLVIGGAS